MSMKKPLVWGGFLLLTTLATSGVIMTSLSRLVIAHLKSWRRTSRDLKAA